jgi:adenine-specific DNA-methyltransferase
MSRHIDKEALVAAIKQSQELSDEQKADILELISTKKKYGLVWEDSNEDAYEELKTKLPILREVENRRILNDTESEHYPNHLLIEGENLQALVALTYTHAGMIDVIYIDPPYNTGNKDFIYNDSFIGEDDEYRHSKWLSFMERRLKIAKKLLSDKGVIFISIDENEVAQLRILADEIFGPSNFVGQWNWYKSATPPALSKKIKRNIEYVLCWKRENNNETFKGVKKTSSSNDPFTKPQNSLKELFFPANSITCKMQDGIYPSGTYGTDKFPNELLDDLIVEGGKNKYGIRFRNRFIWLQSTLDENISNGLYVELSKKLVLSYKRGEYAPEVPPNLIDMSVGVDTTENAGRQLAEIFNGNQLFDYPKPISLIKYILGFPYNNGIRILDFFAGSGTTLHATMQLNAEDGGHRQCILVTNNENNICEEVTYERNKRVILGYTTPKGEQVVGLTKNNLRYYKLDLAERTNDHQQNRELMRGLKDLLCIKDNIYQEVIQFGALSLKGKESMLRCFAEGEQQMLMVYDSRVIPYLVKEIMQKPKADTQIKIYLFADGAYPYTEDFAAVMDKVQLIPMPYAYLRGVKYSLPEANPSWTDNADLTEDEQQEMMAEAIEAENNENE